MFRRITPAQKKEAGLILGAVAVPALTIAPGLARAAPRADEADPASVAVSDEIVFGRDATATAAKKVELTYRSGVRKLDAATEKQLTKLLREAKVWSATISSTERNATEQASAMYANLAAPGGVQAQKELYGPSGDKVIDVYVEQKAKGRTPAQIRAAMVTKIDEVGCSKVSLHCGGSGEKVLDIAPSSVTGKRAFVRFVEGKVEDGSVKKFLHPGNSKDPAYHIVLETE